MIRRPIHIASHEARLFIFLRDEKPAQQQLAAKIQAAGGVSRTKKEPLQLVQRLDSTRVVKDLPIKFNN